MNNITMQYESLKTLMLKLLSNKSYSANRNHVNKIAAQMRYLEKMIKPEVKAVK